MSIGVGVSIGLGGLEVGDDVTPGKDVEVAAGGVSADDGGRTEHPTRHNSVMARPV